MLKDSLKKYSGILRLSLSLILLYIIYRKVDFQTLKSTLSNISLSTFILLCLMYFIGQSISCVKWKLFLDSAKVEKNYKSIFPAYFFGMFINSFGGLGTIGGDLARSIALKPKKGLKTACLATVAADRIHGLATILLLGAVSISIFRPSNLNDKFVFLCFLGAIFLSLLWVFGPKSVLFLLPKNNKIHSTLNNASSAFPKDFKKLLYAGILSLALHSIQIFMIYIITKELNIKTDLSYLFCIVPIVNVASALPISTNGLGVREAMFASFLTPLGVSIEKIAAIGALWLIVVTVVSAIGGILLAPKLIFNKRID